VEHEICAVAYKLKMIKAVYKMELNDTRALCCVMKVVRTLWDQQNLWNKVHNLSSRVLNIKHLMKEIRSL
jgi:hypothetical protein